MCDLLSIDVFYEKIDMDAVTERVFRVYNMLDDLLLSEDISFDLYSYLKVSNPRIPVIQGLPKVHKSVQEPPMRPIVAGQGWLTEPMSIYVEYFVRPLVNNIPHILRDSKQFLLELYEYMKSLDDLSDFTLVTLDVVSLFTKIPNDVGVLYMQRFLQSKSDFIDKKVELICLFMETILYNNVFMFGDSVYSQKDGVAMGTPCAKSYTNVVVAQWEETFLFKSQLFKEGVGFYKRFVDDLFLIWLGDVDGLLLFFEEINASTDFLKLTSNFSKECDCIRCPEDFWPNTAKDFCITKHIEFLSYEDSLGTALVTFSVVFSLIPIAVFCIFLKYRNTPVVRANNREVSYFLLLTLQLCLLTPLIFIGRPKNETCVFRQPAFGIFFSICVSSILAKTITVVIAFNATKPGSRLRNYIGPKMSFATIFCCSVIQCCICVVWLSVSPPFSESDKSYPGKIVIQCNEGSLLMFYLMLAYLGILATVSLVTAFLARNLPDSFNETRFITFSMIVFISVWLSFIPAYISTKGKYMVAVEIFAIFSSSVGLLICIFLPKCYIILMRPDMNAKGHITRQ
ncbi:extracellular calcium-sensing receptor-like [Protopterus annectens]|uniref:extracellular calcium-sensing receptor-like n=1 Tax=Protopterus annectens TaxID=7888 RepID=UPI001CFC45FE|nr:extracellular calcium-sensing receptor-like [Protopterus annectens]